MRDTVLLWLERGLLALGAGLAVWCAAILVEARFTKNLPPPPITVTQTLPGDANGPTGTSGSAVSPPPGTWLARLEAPSVHMATTVLEGSDDGTLSRGAGHIEDTPFPGQRGNIGIAGHRDTVFRPLRNVHVGDPLDLTTADRVYHYRINKTSIVDPDDVYVLDPTSEPTVTLVTCYPFEYIGHAPRRYIVQAQLVGENTRTEPAGTVGQAGRDARTK
jgi:LPXTG-site transpeptidase (sortase) family protein